MNRILHRPPGLILPARLSRVRGFFNVQAGPLDENGQQVVREETGWFPNLITNTGMNLIGTRSGRPFTAVQVGAGTATPVFGDTTLANRIAGTETMTGTPASGWVATAPRYGWVRYSWRFGQGVAAGNIAEIGVSVSAASALFSRALVVDGLGNPTTITVLATDFLTVTYEYRVYPNHNETVIPDVMVDGAPYTLTIRPQGYGSGGWILGGPFGGGAYTYPSEGSVGNNDASFFEAVLPAIGSTPSGTPTNITPTTAAYIADSHYREFRHVVPIGSANFATGIGCMVVGSGIGSFGVGFSPKLPKDNTKQLEITTRLHWARF